MRNLFIFTLSFLSFFASGQSARKQNKQLKAEYAVLVKDYTKIFDQYDSLSVEMRNERELFLQKKKVAEQQRNLLRENLRSCRQMYENLKKLEFTKDIAFSLASFDTIRVPDLHFSELDAANDRFKMNQLYRVYLPETMQSKKLKEQNVEYAEYIRHLKSDTLLISLQIGSFEEIMNLYAVYGPKYDSIFTNLKNRNNELSLKRLVLDKLIQQARTNYQTKGPKGFNAYYADFFPELFSITDELLNKEVFISGDFEEIVPAPVVDNTPEPEQEVEIFDVVEESAQFSDGKNGGLEDLKKYIANNIKYPENALKLGLQGKCYLKFVVSKYGNISNVKVVRGVPDCPECDKEAVRVVKSMPNWIPAKIQGKAVNSYYTLPISFKL